MAEARYKSEPNSRHPPPLASRTKLTTSDYWSDYHDMIASYKDEINDLQKEVHSLRNAAVKAANTSRSLASLANSSGAGPADAARVAELEAELSRLEAENLVLSTQAEGAAAEAALAVERVAEEKELKWNAKVLDAVDKANEANAKEMQQLRRERKSLWICTGSLLWQND